MPWGLLIGSGYSRALVDHAVEDSSSAYRRTLNQKDRHRRAGLGAPGCRRGRRFFRRALSTLKVTPREVVTDAAAVYPGVLDELIPSAWHHVEQYANNPIEADHSQLKHRLRPMRRLRTEKKHR
jgi:hypothetical protein